MTIDPVHYSDLCDADPPPRELTSTMRGFLFHQSFRASRAFGLAVFAFAIGVVFLVRFPGAVTAAIAGATGFVLALATLSVLKRKRRLTEVLVHGVQTPASIAAAQHNAMSTGVGVKARWSDLTVELPGRTARLISLDPSMEVLEPGCWIRVLVHPDHPDLVVPVSSIT